MMRGKNQCSAFSIVLLFLVFVCGCVFLCPSAAEAAGGAQGSPLSMLLPFIIIFAFLYFMMIRPQRQQQKQRKEMLGSLKVGDKVVTSGGIYGTITKVNPQSLRVKIAKGVEVRVSRSGVSGKTSKDDSED